MSAGVKSRRRSQRFRGFAAILASKGPAALGQLASRDAIRSRNGKITVNGKRRRATLSGIERNAFCITLTEYRGEMAEPREKNVNVRMTADEVEMLLAIADAKGLSISDVIRQYVRAEHAKLERKASR